MKLKIFGTVTKEEVRTEDKVVPDKWKRRCFYCTYYRKSGTTCYSSRWQDNSDDVWNKAVTCPVYTR